MSKRRFRLPSPALVVSMLALALALGGTAFAANSAVSAKAAQKDRKADSKLIKKLAPTLSVKHAKTAAAATSATTATHAATADSATSATNATNAANATNLGGVAASSYLTNSGAIFISTGSSNWHSLNSTDPVEWGYFDNTTAVTSTSAGSVYLVAHPSLPTILYGKKLEATAATVCYSAAASAKLEQVTVSQNTYSTGGNGNGVNLVVDNTQRTGNACRTYTFASPGVLSSLDDVNIDFLVDFSGAGKEFDIGLTGLTLMPTATPAGASHR